MLARLSVAQTTALRLRPGTIRLQGDRTVRNIATMRHGAAITIALVGGFAIMVLEIIGVRYLANYFGGSFYVWTSQIGVILIALSLGYYAGGALADRFRHAAVMAWLLIPTGVFVGLIPAFADHVSLWIVMRHPVEESIPLVWQKLDPALGSALIFLWPCFTLAMLSPCMIRLVAHRVTHVGRISGLMYAASTVGSIAGVFASGYILIDLMPLSQIFYATAGLIILLGIACIGLDRLPFAATAEEGT